MTALNQVWCPVCLHRPCAREAGPVYTLATYLPAVFLPPVPGQPQLGSRPNYPQSKAQGPACVTAPGTIGQVLPSGSGSVGGACTSDDLLRLTAQSLLFQSIIEHTALAFMLFPNVFPLRTQ